MNIYMEKNYQGKEYNYFDQLIFKGDYIKGEKKEKKILIDFHKIKNKFSIFYIIKYYKNMIKYYISINICIICIFYNNIYFFN